jgi:hypothetical protein
MHPPATHTSPAGHALPTPQGATQWSSTHALLPLHVPPSAVAPHGVGLPLHTFVFGSHEKPVGQGAPFAQLGVHTPATHCSAAGHCVVSKHWSCGATHVPLRHFEPGVLAHSVSLWHPLKLLSGAPPSGMTLATH